MVFVEEIEDDEPVAELPARGKGAGDAGGAAEVKKDPALRRGFLAESSESLYGPEGSPEGVVAPETHKAHTEHKLNKDMNEGMNRGAKDNNGLGRPEWYTPDWPKDCQYNSPGCTLGELEGAKHASELHRDSVRQGERWEEAMSGTATIMRMSFMGLNDEDMEAVVERLRGNDTVTELDLSHNKIKDLGVQTLVGALANGMAPNLQELRIYSNEFGDLGRTMLAQGLKVLRKSLKVTFLEPSYGVPLAAPKPAAPAAA